MNTHVRYSISSPKNKRITEGKHILNKKRKYSLFYQTDHKSLNKFIHIYEKRCQYLIVAFQIICKLGGGQGQICVQYNGFTLNGGKMVCWKLTSVLGCVFTTSVVINNHFNCIKCLFEFLFNEKCSVLMEIVPSL